MKKQQKRRGEPSGQSDFWFGGDYAVALTSKRDKRLEIANDNNP